MTGRARWRIVVAMSLADLLFWFGLAVALAYLPMTQRAVSWPRTAAKTAPLLAFSLAALIGGGAPWLAAGLFFSAVGDLALSRRAQAAFLYGLSAFALAHLLYIRLFLADSGTPLWGAFAAQPPLALALVVVGLSAELWLVPHVGGLRWPVRLYVLTITLMGLAALTLPLGLITLGAGLFIASDTMLAVQIFRLGEDHPRARPLGRGVWGAYVAGQALILLGAG
ncbi:MAG: hypothetical protein AUK37_08800 [Rhodobacterales bacterium CG2_30_65_12]|nr:MAG: hypothetical protein AUK37_08800 [Rhodobacterales bacterium CG2_30_65_12]